MAKKVLGRDPFTLIVGRHERAGAGSAPAKAEQGETPPVRRAGGVRGRRRAQAPSTPQRAVPPSHPVGRPVLASLERRLERRLERMDGEVAKTLDALEEKLSRAFAVAELSERVERLDREVRTFLDAAEGGLASLERAPGIGSGAREQVGLVRRFVRGLGDLFESVSPAHLAGRLTRRGMRSRAMEVDEFGLDRVFESKLVPFLRFLYESYWRVETTGIANVPNEGRALMVANHAGVLPYDGLMIKYAVLKEHPARREVRFLVEDFVYHFPFFASFISRAGGARACQENAERLLAANELVCVFPEGIKGAAKRYRERYQLQRFGRGGFITLCMRTKSPLIPVAVVGSEEIHPIVAKLDWIGRPLGLPVTPVTPTFPWLGPFGLLPLPSKWHIHFGEPIDIARHGERAIEDNILVNRLKEEARSIIQEMIKESLKQRRSPFLG